MRKTGVPEELKSEITWGEAQTVHPKVALWAQTEYPNMPYYVHVIDRDDHIKNHEAKMVRMKPPTLKVHMMCTLLITHIYTSDSIL